MKSSILYVRKILTKGGYTVQEPDGTTRVVEYTSDKHKGFNAIVKKIGHAQHPQEQWKAQQQLPLYSQQKSLYSARLIGAGELGAYSGYGFGNGINLHGIGAVSYANVQKHN